MSVRAMSEAAKVLADNFAAGSATRLELLERGVSPELIALLDSAGKLAPIEDANSDT